MPALMGRNPKERTTKIGAKITKAREDKGMTQTDAANELEVSLRTWQRWETGELAPTKRDILAIQVILGCKLI